MGVLSLQAGVCPPLDEAVRPDGKTAHTSPCVWTRKESWTRCSRLTSGAAEAVRREDGRRCGRPTGQGRYGARAARPERPQVMRLGIRGVCRRVGLVGGCELVESSGSDRRTRGPLRMRPGQSRPWRRARQRWPRAAIRHQLSQIGRNPHVGLALLWLPPRRRCQNVIFFLIRSRRGVLPADVSRSRRRWTRMAVSAGQSLVVRRCAAPSGRGTAFVYRVSALGARTRPWRP
jgi:hypothetical protein